VTTNLDLNEEQAEWLAQQYESLTTELVMLTPSEWAEQKRYLPPEATPLPGLYRFSVAPYLREIVDCFSADSPVREVAVMKGVQVCMTTGTLENVIGYYIDHVKSAPMMMVTADAELAKLRMENNITKMLQLSGLAGLIKSSDEGNARKTGKTDAKIEWIGGGFLIPFGAVNANKLRSIPIQVLLRDEIDGWPDRVGKDGDPIKLSGDRTAAYEATRRILDLSTPTIKGQSKIEKRFAFGDQRYYHVCCLGCGFPQVLRWNRVDKDGVVSGIVWELDNGMLAQDSVRYLCENCGHAHTNDDKTRLLAPENGAEWRPTATPSTPHIRSYHLSALYSPVGMQSWEECVRKWLEAWDPERNAPRDMDALQVFYNNVLGVPFELRGEKLRFDQVSSHRRHWYSYGEIPNKQTSRFCGGPVLVITCAVDVHADNLAVSVVGWCRDRRPVQVDYWRFPDNEGRKPEEKVTGNTEDLNDPHTWGALRKLIDEREYVADDGKRYRLQLTLVDSGYRAEQAYSFCYEYERGVIPVKGREYPPKAATFKEFSPFETPLGQRAMGITVDVYKERLSASLRRHWDGETLQPVGHFNAPIDATDKQLKELTVETKVEKIDPRTKQRVGWEWRRPSGAANELWDTLVYNAAALDMLAWDHCIEQLEMDSVDWPAFYRFAEGGAFYSE
jgi:phage terminase large subunit GpA-like protein